MAIGKKYSALTRWLLQCGRDTVRLSFDELAQIIPIPDHAYKFRTSWANAQSPQSFNSSWIFAGYVVDEIDMDQQWVVFTKAGIPNAAATAAKKMNIISTEKLTEIIQCGLFCYDGIAGDHNHRYLSWEHCHKVFKKNKGKLDQATTDYLSLHLAWYLASWGMLRNSFLMQKDYRIHAPVVQLLMQPEWYALWDISAENMAQEFYARKIMDLCEGITRLYVETAGGQPSVTLLTKILLGTLGCTPAYDQYFRKGVSESNAAAQTLGVKSIMALGELYVSYIDQFSVLERYCSERMAYPPAKIIDMCFFQYGLKLSGRERPEDM